MRSSLSVTGDCNVCGKCADMCTTKSASDGVSIDHLCFGCLQEAVKQSSDLNLAIRGFKKKYGIPSFAVNELAGAEMAARRTARKRP